METKCPSLSSSGDVSLPKVPLLEVESSETFFDLDESIFTEDFGELSTERYLELFVENVDMKQARLEKEAMDFLQELFDSDEYKNRKDVKDVSTQVFPRYLQEFQKEMEEYDKAQIVVDYPLTKYTQEKHKNELIEETRRKCRENRILLENQKKSIRNIKNALLELAKDADRGEMKRRNAIKLEKLAANIDTEVSKYHLVVVSAKKFRQNQIIGRKKRMERILSKLIHEDNMRRRIRDLQNKTYDYKVKRRERIIYGMEIIGRKIPLERDFDEEEDYEEISEEEEVGEEEEIQQKPKKEKKGVKKGKSKTAGGKGSKKSKKSKGSKKDKKKKGKSKKKDKSKNKKKKKGELVEEFTLPEIPVVNPRRKIKNADPEYMKELVEIDEKYRSVLDDIEMQRKKLFEAKTYEKDNLLVCHPDPLIFSDIENSYTYRKRVSIVNRDSVPKKIKLLKAEIPNGETLETIEVENFGIYLLVPGLTLTFPVTIFPKGIFNSIQGQITFVTWTSKKPEFLEYSMKIECLLPTEEITVSPATICFGSIDYWKAKNRTFEKKVKIVNNSTKACQVHISKILDSMDLEMCLMSGCEEEENSEASFNVDRYFSFSKNVVYLEPLCGAQILATLKNIDYVGDYFEKYQFKIHQKDNEDSWQILDCKDVTLSAETIPYFISTEPEILDFEITCFDSIYQNEFRIFNHSNLPQRLLVSFPSSLKRYLTCNTPEVIVSANSSLKIVVKFQPLQDIVKDSNSYDDDTNILNFSIRVSLVTKDKKDYPTLKVYVFAILTSNMPLILQPLHPGYVTSIYTGEENGSVLMVDCGKINVRESVFVKLGVINFSPAVQHFGFLNVPQYATICPNYGFGMIGPYQSKILKVILSLQNQDLSCDSPQGAKKQLFFKLSVTTIKNLGSLKKSFDFKSLRKSLVLMETVLKNKKVDTLEEEMVNCVEHLRNDIDFNIHLEMLKVAQFAEGEHSVETEPDSLISSPAIDISKQDIGAVKNNTVWFNCILVDAACKLSHETVVLPNTPCGSYSTMSVGLTYTRKDNSQEEIVNYSASFEVFSSNPFIAVEPKCGKIRSKETKILNVIARPEIPENIVQEKAKQVKKDEIFEKKKLDLLEKRKREMELKLELAAKKKGKKDKGSKKSKKSKKSSKSSKKSDKEKPSKKGKGKKGKKKDKSKSEVLEPEDKAATIVEEPLPEIIVKDSEVIITPFDLYPAEMILWREFKPYTMEATFTIKILLAEDQKKTKNEELYLRALCRVTMPDFAHNLESQHIDFGPTVVGDSKRMILEVRNIKNVGITPKLEKLGTQGTFTCPSVISVPLPSEHILTLPISFFPKETKSVIEFFEIRSGNTKCPLILSGLGLESKLTFKPDFLVCRLDADGEYKDFSIEVVNSTTANVTLSFEKIFELEGEIKECPKPEEPKEAKGKGKKGDKKKKDKKSDKSKKSDKKSKKSEKKSKKSDKKSKKSKKSDKKSKKGKGKAQLATSQELTDDEKFSLENFFERRTVLTKPLFEIVNGSKIEIPPASRKTVTLRFGTAPVITEEEKGKKKGGKKGKKKGSKKDKSSSKKGKSSKKSSKKSKSSKSSKGGKKKKGKSKAPTDTKVYVTKFNILLGTSTFFKDFVAFGKFI